MKVRDLMTSHICCVSPDMTIENASKLMRGADIGVVPVCDGGGIVGIVTDRDIITRGISKGFGPGEKIEKVMTKNVVSIMPDADIKEAVKVMGDRQVRRLPVVTGREIVGMLSVGDIARYGKLDAEVAKAECGIAEMYKN
ncbi:MAG: CBS domain-containing protein [Oscillospiraceae bacterium]|nr:CBS domain-containing protein [Oscillospiraceae bacterium]